jgi:flagellin-like hook-associated protein FlgL
MARISASLSGLERTLLNRLAEARAGAALSTLRLTSGHRINRPDDDPAAFVALSNYRTRQATVRATLANAQAAGSLASQAQLALDRIRTQVNLVRTLALEDEDQQLSPAQRAANQQAIDAALAEINRLAGTLVGGKAILSGAADFTASGQNRAQVRELQVFALGGGGPTVAARRAELFYAGLEGHVAADASITLAGELGSTTLAFTSDQSLAEAARKINQRANTTGVSAEVRGGHLVFVSASAGRRGAVSLEVNAGTFAVTGGDGQGRAQGRDAAYGPHAAISGWVSQPATQARLTYTGSAGHVAADATLALTGDRGSAQITLDDADTLAEAAQKINLQSHRTGVTAQAAGNTLTLASVAFGARARVAVEVTSGTFATTGGSGDGTAQGSDAQAVINGVAYRGYQPARPAAALYTGALGKVTHDAEFTVTGPLGSFDFTVSSGNDLTAVRDAINLQSGATGVVATAEFNDLVLRTVTSGSTAEIDIEVTDGAFDVEIEPGKAESPSAGVDGNRITIDQGGFRFSLEFAPGFVGEFNSISVRDDALAFALSTHPGRSTPLPIPSLLAERLGGASGSLADLASGGAASGLGTNAPLAVRIADEALGALDRVQGLVDGFANSSAAATESLMSAFDEDLGEAIDQLDRVDEAKEALLREKYNALVTNSLAGLAVLNQQRQELLQIVRRFAGLE